MSKATVPVVKAYNDKGVGKGNVAPPRAVEQTGFQKKQWDGTHAVWLILGGGGGGGEVRYQRKTLQKL